MQISEQVVAVEPAGLQREPASSLPTWVTIVTALVAGMVVVAAAYRWAGLDGTPRLVAAGIGLVVCGRCAWQLARAAFGPAAEIGLWLSVTWLGLLSFAAVLADLLPISEARNPSKTLADPNLLRPDLFSKHPFGTDRAALDILGGVIYGARVSLVVGVGAVAIGLAIGLPIGMIAGFYRRRTEMVIDFLTNSMLAFPPIILLLAMVSVLKPSVQNVTMVLGIISIPIYIRISKINTMVYAQREFVLAAVVSGAKKRRILARELLPCVLPPVLAYGVVVVAVAIVSEAALSFLGLSIQRPDPTWGNMIAAGQDTYTKNPHLVFVPGAVLVATVLSLNHINQVLRRKTDHEGAKL